MRGQSITDYMSRALVLHGHRHMQVKSDNQIFRVLVTFILLTLNIHLIRHYGQMDRENTASEEIRSCVRFEVLIIYIFLKTGSTRRDCSGVL